MPRRLRLWLGPVLMCAVDAAVTMACQSPAYWAGEYGAAQEANPLGYWLLVWHPLAFAGGALASMALYALLIERLPPALARVAAFVILFLHALGGASWVVGRGVVGFAAAVAWVAVASWVLRWSWRDDPLGWSSGGRVGSDHDR